MYRLERENLAPALPRLRSVRLLSGLALLTLWAPTPALAWGGHVRLTRRYQSGQKMVYTTKTHTKAVIHSEPPELQNFGGVDHFLAALVSALEPHLATPCADRCRRPQG